MSFKGLLVGVTGLNSQSKKMEVIGNNLANVNTTGYKKSEVTFQELFYDTIKGASSGDGALLGGTNAMTIGGGVGLASITNVFTQGSREATGRTLDFMIEGEDFFVTRNAGDGSLMLTRNGSFQLDADMNLVDSLGNKVQGFNVDRETGAISAEADNIIVQSGSIDPNATSLVQLEANIDSSVSETVASSETNAWEIFSGGENFGAMTVSVPGGSGARDSYGSGYYQDNHLYQDDAATLSAGLDVVTLNAVPAGLIDGFAVGDTVNVVQGTEQVQRTITAVNAGTREVTLNAAAPGTFAAGAMEITNLSDASATMGTSGSALVHNDVLKSQISMVDADGNLIASFYRVTGPAEQYTHSTATVAGGSEITVGVGEFTDMQELKDLMELALRDSQLTNYASSTDLDLGIDKFGKVTFGGTGLVQEFRLVMNADNSEMLDRFDGIAMTDDGAVATTQARVDTSGEVIAAPALGMGTRSVHGSKWWFNTSGLETYGYSATDAATEYGEFAGLRFDGGATGSGFGIIQISSVNALGETVTSEFTMVPRDADPNNSEFSTMGELAKLIQNTLRTEEFSSIASDGTLVSDNSASVSFTNGRLNVSTSNGVFQDLRISPVNTDASATPGITRSDYTNFGTVLGSLATGISGKSGSSNVFVNADARVQTAVYDSQGNEHTTTQYFVRDRSSGLTNIEWKFKSGLNPNLNSFASTDDSQSIYANTYNSIADSEGARGVLAFDITSGEVLGANSGADSRYVSNANITFLAATDSQEANVSDINIDFTNLTSYNGQNTVIGTNIDGYGMGSLVRITTEENTGNINGIYSNGKIRTLAKIGLMSIANPEGLEKVGSSYYSQTPNSNAGGNTKGIDQIFSVGAESPASSDSVTSQVHGGALEASNVDLTEELTDMIITQRSFSASGKIITTTDDMLQEALNLKR